MTYFNHANQRLHYLDQGQGEPVLLLHGLGSRAQDWTPQIAALSRHFRVLALDLRGHGDSDKAREPFQMADLARDAAALMGHLNLTHYQVVGFSLGGMVAFELALLCPAQVHSLAIINSGPEVASHSWRLQAQLTLRLAMIRLLGMRRLARMIGRNLFPLQTQHELLATFENQMASMDAPSYRHALRAIARFSVAHRLAELRLPVCVISADHDYTPVMAKAAYANQLANAELVVIEQSRHASPLDQPEQVNRALCKFLYRTHGTKPVEQRPANSVAG